MGQILVVDDDSQVRDMMQEMLAAAGHRTTVAEDGVTAVQIMQGSAAFDLAIVDILMPGMNGLDTIRELRAQDTALKIVAFSGGGDFHRFDLLEQALALGADVTMTKPLDMEELLTTVSNLLHAPA